MGQFNTDISESFQLAMEGFCLELLHQGYEAMLSAKGYDVDWEEDTLTAHYISLMEKLPLCRERRIDIIPQFYIYSSEHTSGEIEAKFAPRIDFKFTKWFKDVKTGFYAEAKNVSEKDWKKKTGASVNSLYYYKRYIETGVSHLLSGHYPSNCVMIAYVLNGNKNAILSNLNNRISKDFTNYGIITKPTTSVHDEFYISENQVNSQSVTLKHLFLQLA
jgi:hypothetical protein